MLLSSRILGATTVRELSERTAAPVLVIGRDRFARADLARVRCFNFAAAANLSRALASLDVSVTSVAHLFKTVPPSAVMVAGVGAVAIAVLGAAFELKRIGGTQPLEAWVRQHRPEGATHEYLTVHTMKAQAAAAEAAAQKGRRR